MFQDGMEARQRLPRKGKVGGHSGRAMAVLLCLKCVEDVQAISDLQQKSPPPPARHSVAIS